MEASTSAEGWNPRESIKVCQSNSMYGRCMSLNRASLACIADAVK